MYLNKGNFNLRRTRRDRLTFVALYTIAIIALLYFWFQLEVLQVIPKPGVATATATRSPQSYSEEAEKQFSAGQLNQAIAAYGKAIELEPKRVDYWIKLARIQVYADQAEEAVTTVETAILLDPTNSTAHAVYALALDWNGRFADASDAAVRAIQLDSNNALAYAYYAEVLVDQQRWSQARDAAKQALTLDPNSMDAFRVYGWYLESTANYEEAIQQYQSAIRINPNLGFLYMQVGANFRVLAGKSTLDEEQASYYDLAAQYFQRAAAINPDSIDPLLALSRTEFQRGQYGAAAQYLESALEIDPANAQVHGRLGLIYFKALNFESSIIELSCAVEGCTTQTDTIDDIEGAPDQAIVPLELNKDSLEIYYTYSSVLASLAVPEQGKPYCNKARPLFAKIQDWLKQNPGNEFVDEILVENETVCQIADANASQAALDGKVTQIAPAGTGTPGPTPTGTPAP